ncbi:MAG: YraN family protein [Acidobacteriota bacterium]
MDHPSDFTRLPHTRARGRLGEDEAVRWLLDRGYRVIERNAANRVGEIDVVAEQGGDLCFVEIKARANRTFGSALEAVPPAKQRKLARAASLYLVHHPTDLPCRFDVLAMDLADDGWRFTLVRDAFRLA